MGGGAAGNSRFGSQDWGLRETPPVLRYVMTASACGSVMHAAVPSPYNSGDFHACGTSRSRLCMAAAKSSLSSLICSAVGHAAAQRAAYRCLQGREPGWRRIESKQELMQNSVEHVKQSTCVGVGVGSSVPRASRRPSSMGARERCEGGGGAWTKPWGQSGAWALVPANMAWRTPFSTK